MDEHTVLILLGIAAVAATFAGFSGVVAVFGRRAHGEWFLEDRFRLTNMLATSLGACLFAFVPLIELLLHLHGPPLWTVGSLLMCAYCMAYIMQTIPQWQHLWRVHPGLLSARVSAVVWISSFLAALLQLMNAVSIFFHREPGPYVLGLLLLLIIAGVQFALLVLRPLTAHRAHAHPDEAAELAAEEAGDAHRVR
jgi:hypothetical protein